MIDSNKCLSQSRLLCSFISSIKGHFEIIVLNLMWIKCISSTNQNIKSMRVGQDTGKGIQLQ